MGELTVPAGYCYLDPAQSRRVLTKYWHNPDGTSLGMLFPKDKGPPDEHSRAYVIKLLLRSRGRPPRSPHPLTPSPVERDN